MIVLGGIDPDITFLLDADAHLSFCRVLQRGCPDRIEAKGQTCFEAVRSNYLQLAAKHGWFVLDASQPINSLADEIHKLIGS